MQGGEPTAESHGEKWPGSSRRVCAASFAERTVQKVIIVALPLRQNAGSLGVLAAATVRVGPDRARPMEPVGALAATNFDQLALSHMPIGIRHARCCACACSRPCLARTPAAA